MNETISFVAELDQRQDDVIRALDALNQRIEEVIKTWGDLRLDSIGEPPARGAAAPPLAAKSDDGTRGHTVGHETCASPSLVDG